MGKKRNSTRREFLKGRAAVDRLLDFTQGEASAAEFRPGEYRQAKSGSAVAGYLEHYSRRAMACQFEIYFNPLQYSAGTEAALEALDRVEQLEDQLSIYRDHSELSQLNRLAADGPVRVEAGLFDLLRRSRELFDATGGAFDITASPLSRAWGFFRRAGKVPSADELAAALEKVGGDQVDLDETGKTVSFGEPGMELSLNSIGKGYALDRSSDLLRQSGIDDFLYHGGQSSVVAAGSPAGSPRPGWRIGLRHPLRPERRLAEFWLQDKALGTSGSGTQFFHYQGKRFGHVLDPRSGQPACGVYSSTVIAETAADADALATAFYVMGPDLAREYCRQHAGLAMILVCPGPREGNIKIHTHGIETGHWQLLEPVSKLESASFGSDSKG